MAEPELLGQVAYRRSNSYWTIPLPFSQYVAVMTELTARVRRRDEASRKATALEAKPEEAWTAIPPARFHAAVGDGSLALALVEQAVQGGFDDPRRLLVPEFDLLCHDAAIARLVETTKTRAGTKRRLSARDARGVYSGHPTGNQVKKRHPSRDGGGPS